MNIQGTAHAFDLFPQFSDKLLRLAAIDGGATDKAPWPDRVTFDNGDGTTTQAAYEVYPLGRAQGLQYLLREVDAHGQTQRMEFMYGHSRPGADEDEVAAGSFERQPDGSYQGQMALGIPGFDDIIGPETVHAPGAIPLIPPEFEKQLDAAGAMLAERFCAGPEPDSTGVAPNLARVEFSPVEAAAAADVLDRHLTEVWQVSR
ncbi:MAG: hypothetical protein ACYCW6_02130 [Candidatus Xenobia bacterium]